MDRNGLDAVSVLRGCHTKMGAHFRCAGRGRDDVVGDVDDEGGIVVVYGDDFHWCSDRWREVSYVHFLEMPLRNKRM